MKVTVVVPTGYIANLLLVILTFESQMSVAFAIKFTTVPFLLSCHTVTSGGHVMFGGVLSCTVMSTVSVSGYCPSETVKVTVVVPNGKVAVGVTPGADPSVHTQLYVNGCI